MSFGEPKAEVSARATARVAITRLMLTNFRSYGMLDLRVEAGHVVLVGPNGAGKTNVLEALSMLAPGRGLRGVKLSELARAAPGEAAGRPWSVSATCRAVKTRVSRSGQSGSTACRSATRRLWLSACA
jgi:DNA replication and repair protein RecF